MVTGLSYSCLSSVETEKSDQLKLRRSSEQFRIVRWILSDGAGVDAGAGVGAGAQSGD